MVKKAKRKSTKKKQPKLKKNDADYFVSNFLRQPGKTRSGIRYSRITNSKTSAESIFGSLMSLTGLSNQPTKLQTAKDQCSCKQCKDNRSKTVTSNHSGLSLMLKSEGNSNSLPHLTKSMPSSVLPKNRQSADSKYCDCYECTGLIDLKDVQKQLKGMLQQSMGIISCEDNNYGLSGDQQYISKDVLPRNSSDMKMQSLTKCKQLTSNQQKRHSKRKEGSTKVQRLKHPLEKCKPRRYKKKVKMVQTNVKQSHKGKARKGKPTKSLLKFVLKKKSSIRQRNGKVSPQKPKERQACTCCQRFQNMIRLIGKANNSHVSLDKRRSKSAGNLANQFLHCTKSGCTETPFASAGYNHMNKTKTIKRSQSVKKMDINESRNVLPPSTKSIQHLNQTATNKKNKSNKKVTNYTRVKKNLGVTKQPRLKLRKEGSTKSTKRRRVKWVLLTDKLIKALKDKAKRIAAQNKAKQNKERGFREQMKQDIAPTPSWGSESKSSHKRESSRNKYLRSSLSTTLQVINSTQRQSSGTNDIPRTPFPSSKMPTYIAMVKTAIRDLTPYRMTGKEAISKYIQIRYHIQNDVLLRYILKWMLDMKITKLKNGNYYFSGKRLIKKHTVAVLSKSQKRKKKKKRSKAKKRKRSSKVSKPIKKKSKRKKGKGKGKKKKRKCTCSQQKNATKNRVKLRSHYIRKHGKIYKQDEYV